MLKSISNPYLILFALSVAIGCSALAKIVIPLLPKRRSPVADQGISVLQKWVETLESGNVPDTKLWVQLKSLGEPWGSLISVLIDRLRREGAAILPTLRRIRRTMIDQKESWLEAKTQIAQARAQLWLALGMIPLMSLALWVILPEVKENSALFFSAIGIALMLGGGAFFWMEKMIDRALWAKIPKEHRDWIQHAILAGERFQGLLETGLPPDLAWRESVNHLRQTSPELAEAWESAIWVNDRSSIAPTRALFFVTQLGNEVKRSIQTSVLDGHSCSERVATLFDSFRSEWRARVNRELKVLPTKALKPLFIGVLPGVFLVLGSAFVSVFFQMMSN